VSAAPAALASVHVLDFASPRRAAAWRRALARRRVRVGGLAWSKALTTLGARGREGFALGVPALERQVLRAAWETREAFEAFQAEAALRSLDARGRRSRGPSRR
jgi:hypothetical protein